jgi:hypothetical protein
MGKKTWPPTKGHHWVPENSRWGKQHRKLWEDTYKEFTTPMSGEEHVQTHRDEREVGPIGSVARYDLRRWLAEDLEDEDL